MAGDGHALHPEQGSRSAVKAVGGFGGEEKEQTVGATLGGGSPQHPPVRSPSGNTAPPDPQERLPGSIEQDGGSRQPTQSPSSLSPCLRLLLPDPLCGEVGAC